MRRTTAYPGFRPTRSTFILAVISLNAACERDPQPFVEQTLAMPVDPGLEAVIHPIYSDLLSSSGDVPVRDVSVAGAARVFASGLSALQNFDSSSAIGLMGSSTESADLVFGKLSGAVIGRDGEVLLLDQGNSTIAVLDSELNPNGRFGGSGSGPGEFLSPGTLLQAGGDTVAVLDRRKVELQRFVRRGGKYEPGGNYNVSIEPVSAPNDVCIVNGRPFVSGHVVSARGQVLNSGDLPGFDLHEWELARGFIHEVDGRGGVLNSFSFPYAGMQDIYVALDLASAWLACDQERIWAGYASLGEVHAYTLAGDPIWIVRFTDFDHPGSVHITSPTGERLRAGGPNIDPERGNFAYDYIAETKLISPGTLAVHIVTMKVGGIEEGYPTSYSHRTYLLDAKTGESKGAFEAGHWVLGGGHGKAILYREEPFPQINLVPIAD